MLSTQSHLEGRGNPEKLPKVPGRKSQTKTPHVKRLALVDCYGFRIQGKRLRLTLRPHEYGYIDLNARTLEAIADKYCPLGDTDLRQTEHMLLERRGRYGTRRAHGHRQRLDNNTTAPATGMFKGSTYRKARESRKPREKSNPI
jgi:hypothetical protein